MSTSDTAATDPNLFVPDGEYDDWDDAPITPRAGMPWVTTLLGVAVVAAIAFGGGIYAHKQWGTSSATAGTAGGSGFARRFGGGFGGARGGSAAPPSGASRVTSGQVSYIEGGTLYIADLTGGTVKVSTTGARVTKTSTLAANAIHPGDTVVVIGSRRANGTIAATSITVGGGLAAILGGG